MEFTTETRREFQLQEGVLVVWKSPDGYSLYLWTDSKLDDGEVCLASTGIFPLDRQTAFDMLRRDIAAMYA